MAQTSTSKCSLCSVNNGIYFCYECRKALCKPCKIPHDNIPASKNHTVKDLKCVDLTAFQNISNCKAHNTDFSFYCTQCKVMICGKCVTTIHKGHEFSDIDQIAGEVRGEAGRQLVKMKDKLAKSSMIIEKIKKNHLPEIKNEAKCISKEIKLSIKEVHQIIDSKGDVKITEVEDFETLETDQLRMDLANRQHAHYRFSSLHSTLEQLINEHHAFTFLNAYENLKGDFKELQDMELGSIEVIRPPQFDKQLFMKELIQTLIIKFNISMESEEANELYPGQGTKRQHRFSREFVQAQTVIVRIIILSAYLNMQSQP
ncbi:E3 ubiquitin-protein ligase TRIM33-like [Mytilus trossulus]|uniref:E3 ubiquitin-protein ligase TRIM33-like n=1 Tax=Mytilus trossulus TaxID=6551 RepID=UPI003005F19B